MKSTGLPTSSTLPSYRRVRYTLQTERTSTPSYFLLLQSPKTWSLLAAFPTDTLLTFSSLPLVFCARVERL